MEEVVDEVLKSWDEHARLSNLWGKMVVTAGGEYGCMLWAD